MDMKKYMVVLLMAFLFASCKEEVIKKPENLIEKEKMMDIIYDLSLLQAIRGADQKVLDSNKINPNTYIYKKYKIDSLQFAKSDQYYAAEDIKHYKKMYEKVIERLKKNKILADTLAKKQMKEVKTISVDKKIKGNTKELKIK